MLFKKCSRCGEEKPEAEFLEDARRKSGRYHRCNKCCEEVVADDSGFKRCGDCGLMKPRTEFSRDRREYDGRTVYCKGCRNLRDKARNSRLDGFMKNSAKTAANNARKRNLEWKLTVADLMEMWNQQEGRCALTGIQLTHRHGSGRILTNASIDRIDNDRPYERDNVWLVAAAINRARDTMDRQSFVTQFRALLHEIAGEGRIDELDFRRRPRGTEDRDRRRQLEEENQLLKAEVAELRGAAGEKG